MLVLGIDPGFAILGYSVLSGKDPLTLDDYGVIKTSSQMRLEKRLAIISEDIEHLLAMNWMPDLIAYERPFFKGSNTNAAGVQNALGIVLAAAGRHDIPTVGVTPGEMKAQIAGHGQANKSQVRDGLIEIGLNVEAGPDDAWDAVGIAWVGAGKFNLQKQSC
jgi:crossover junction endodeoxyribonuclease RuvC